MSKYEIVGIYGEPYDEKAHEVFVDMGYVHVEYDDVVKKVVRRMAKERPGEFGWSNYCVDELLYGPYYTSKIYQANMRTPKQVVELIDRSFTSRLGHKFWEEELFKEIGTQYLKHRKVVVTGLSISPLKDVIIKSGGRLIHQSMVLG